MTKSTLKFQTLQVSNRLPPAGGPSARGAAVAAGVELLHSASIRLNMWSVTYRVNKELEKLAPKIEQAMLNYEALNKNPPATTGVLVVVGLKEWEHPDPTGTRAQGYLNMHIGGVGDNFRTVVGRYLSIPGFVQDAPKGWRRETAYVWATRN
jgi:hypothetical protein